MGGAHGSVASFFFFLYYSHIGGRQNEPLGGSTVSLHEVLPVTNETCIMGQLHMQPK